MNLAQARTQARCRRCGTSSQGVQGIVDQNGNAYGSVSGITTIPNFGPHPSFKVLADAGQGRAAPYEIFQNPDDPECFTVRWAAQQNGRNLIAADGQTVLYTAPAESDLSINGASQQGQSTTVGGLTVTPSGQAGHSPSVVVALSTTNPPPFTINSEGQIEGIAGAPATGANSISGCMSFSDEQVPYEDGPGSIDQATAAAYVIDDKPTFICVTDTPTGTERVWVIDRDTDGDWQWGGSV